MGLNDYLKCPGLNQTLATIPIELKCPQCDKTIEIWSDEFKSRCTQCGTTVLNPNPSVNIPDEKTAESNQTTMHCKSEELVELALSMGSDAAMIFPAHEILIENHLANLCKETRCQNYGLSPTCPPNVKGPEWIKKYLKEISHAIYLKIDVHQDVVYADQRREVGRLLHFIVIQIEKAAHEMGLTNSKAFAGGSCRNLFCSDHTYCQVLQGKGDCRNPDSARPSVSGHGINMNHLLKLSGWLLKDQKTEISTSTTARYGVVLIG